MNSLFASTIVNKGNFVACPTGPWMTNHLLNSTNLLFVRTSKSHNTHVHKRLDITKAKFSGNESGTHKQFLDKETMGHSERTDMDKVIIIMGATGVGKSRLSIALATHFPAEIINSDKIQVYKGLDIVSNKVPHSERQDIPHHLLDVAEHDVDFDALDFCRDALSAMDVILRSGKVPIIIGGSNSFLEALVENPVFKFKSRYKCYFIWIDVSLPILFACVKKRVNQMVDEGLVEEVRPLFKPDAVYNKGIRRSIGVPEMHNYFMEETMLDNEGKEMSLALAIEEIKFNTCKLVFRQVRKIKQLRDELRWPIHRIDATTVVANSGTVADEAWEEIVLKPCLDRLNEFFTIDDNLFHH